MAVVFNDESFSITIKDSCPAAFWVGLHNELLSIVAASSEHNEDIWRNMVLLKEMMPNIDDSDNSMTECLKQITGGN